MGPLTVREFAREEIDTDEFDRELICGACDPHPAHDRDDGPCCVLVASGERERCCGCLE